MCLIYGLLGFVIPCLCSSVNSDDPAALPIILWIIIGYTRSCVSGMDVVGAGCLFMFDPRPAEFFILFVIVAGLASFGIRSKLWPILRNLVIDATGFYVF